ncbi:hypothetical protein I316_04130 [Kwoniella heveanensis BCC8398]|uniref:Purine permease n=1 Tax=Kwoniella heveanensis BCC8398 TaxID=1296120 RepID=A0A1B9GSY0_9TREE|nr:hypothetical protein I316_04130 [Kwoniella heveanensis BCC8398]
MSHDKDDKDLDLEVGSVPATTAMTTTLPVQEKHLGGDSEPEGASEPRKNIRERIAFFGTKEAWVGDYDYKYLLVPPNPFKDEAKSPPFFGVLSKPPIILTIILGLQHALAMLAGLTSPALIITQMANLPVELQQYCVSAVLIFCAFGTALQVTRFHIWKTPYYLGSGVLSVVGTCTCHLACLNLFYGCRYANGTCPVDADGNQLPCPDAYGALLGTCAVCALFQILLAFVPPKVLRRIFPPLVTGSVLVLGGISLVSAGMNAWAGGSGSCSSRPTEGDFQLCPNNFAPHPLPWGSAEFIGLGFLVFISIILIERFGSPFMKNASVIGGLLIGSIVAAACNYFDGSTIKQAPVITFLWVHTFPLRVDGTLVLPLLAVLVTIVVECIADITATCDVSRVEVEGPVFNSRIQGGVLVDGVNSLIAALATVTSTTTFAQNNGVIALTNMASRRAGYACCIWLLLLGVFAKFAAALVAIPSSVFGGMTTYLFATIVVSGFRVLSYNHWTRRTRFILTASMAVGIGSIVVPTWFSYVFTYSGSNSRLRGFLDAIVLVVETPQVIATFIGVILNLILKESPEDEREEKRKVLLAYGIEDGF